MNPEIVAVLRDLVDRRKEFQGRIAMINDSHVIYGRWTYARVKSIKRRKGDVVVQFSGVKGFPVPREMFWPTESRVFTNPATGAKYLDQGGILVEGGCCADGGCQYIFTTERDVSSVQDSSSVIG
mgnify:FL=1